MTMLSKRLFSTFKAGDSVLIRSVVRSDRFWLTDPLKPDSTTNVQGGQKISHNDLLGLRSRSIVHSNEPGHSFIATLASTEDYINLSRRAAQPIYPFDASAIVALADLHIDYPDLESPGPPLQFFEAGTGHGSLSLAICSRLHAANCYLDKFGVRGAVLHSIDRNEAHSNVGRKTIRNFRRGIYTKDVEFHLANSPEEWLESETAMQWKQKDPDHQKGEGFLSGAFLDLPDMVPNLSSLAKNLKQDAPLVIFCPSVNQIIDVIKSIKQSHGEIKLSHIRTIQLVPGVGGGLQDWDTRYTTVRNTGEEAVVCRPRVGTRLVGGGFVGLFKKLPNQAVIKTKLLPEVGNETTIETST
ncbi:hypothetical protein BON22_4950 [Cyberlindnera fabianii]|uniref:tRNA (adenine(58)-N(1))-methyltransferase catalytic subunit TRM61 n=1 Tax=Cyberlindnera fabianii TaxID=36022 RepID=A0A1V2L024_CYBFA|nr:hypothetical protein BON22_4950 [Cyberlindnera fabianii]